MSWNTIKNEMYGKQVILFGEPFSGKTTFAMRLSKEYTNTTLLKVDKNYNVEEYDFRGVVYEIYSPKQLKFLIENKLEEKDDHLIILDSLTSLDSLFVPEDPLKIDPSMFNRRASFFDRILQQLSKFKKKGTVLIICHEKIADFRTREVAPRVNRIVLRHCDAVYRLTVENGKRKLKKVLERKVVKDPEIVFE